MDAFLKYDFFYMFGLLSLSEAIWVGMETYCLQRSMTYEKNINWKPAIVEATGKKPLMK